MNGASISFRLKLTAAALTVAVAPSAFATEGGGSIYAPGGENFACCALPPPGLYGMVFVNHYRAETLRDDDGDKIAVPNFSVRATAVVPRIVYITPTTVVGASLGFYAFFPYVDLDVSAGAASQSKSGQGDILFGPVLGWHHSERLHSVLALDIFTPTGSYKKGDLANIGRNYWAANLVGGASYIDPAGFNADIKANLVMNAPNRDTHYRSGTEFIADYALGWGVGTGWVLGVGGYLYQQLTDDSGRGAPANGNRGRTFAIGPSVKYDSGKGWFVTAKWQKENEVRNRAEGDAFWVKAVFPL